MNKQIETLNLTLIACDPEILEKAIDGNKALHQYLKVTVPDNWTEFGKRVLQYALDRLNGSADQYGWWTWLSIHKQTNTLIGSGGYKGKPDKNGMVEIGYEIQSEYRNKGLATELASALIEHAFTHPEVKSVQAHTLGEMNASSKVLLKCGMKKTEVIEDEEDGTLWKWEIKK